MEQENEKLRQQQLEAEKTSKEFEEQLVHLKQTHQEQRQEWEETIRTLLEEKKLLQQGLENYEKELEDKEFRMKTAQQHLAKKVKENTLLNEDLERNQAEKKEIETRYSHYVAQYKEMQEIVKRQQEHESRSHSQWQEALHSLEVQLEKKDEKFFAIFEKYKNLEERYNQVQGLFHNLGHIMHNEPPE